MKVKQQIIKGLLHGILIPIVFICITVIVITIWFMLLKYLDFLLGIFPENIFLTFIVFSATIGALIFGASLYVSTYKIKKS